MNLLISGNGTYSLGQIKGKNFYDLVSILPCSLYLEVKYGNEWYPLTVANKNCGTIQSPFFGKVPILAGAEEARVTVTDFDEAFELFFEPSQAGSLEGMIFSDFTSNLVDTNDRFKVEILGTPSVARQLAAGASSANTVLTSTCRRISIKAVGADIRYSIGTSTQTASSTSHFIADGERLDFAILPNSRIAVIRNASTNGVLEVSELV